MLSLDDRRWGKFAISDVAEIISGRGIYEDERIPGNIPYITASAMNNGVTHFLSNVNDTLEADCISVNSNGSVGYAFYHPYEALYSGDCRKLRLKHRNKYVALFVAVSITSHKDKYNYGYKLGTARLMRQIIQLPIDDEGKPDYAFMEEYMREREQKLIHDYIEYARNKLRNVPSNVLSLEGVRWGKFAIGDLFVLETGKCLKSEMVQKDNANVPYLGATNRNNAVIDFVNHDERLLQEGNCIAFIKDGEGSAGYAVYKAEDFIANFHIIAGYAPFLNRYTGMFITTAADKVRGKYNFNYSRSMERLKKEMIQLPIDDEGNPDWEFMTRYMKAFEERLYLLYLESKASQPANDELKQ